MTTKNSKKTTNEVHLSYNPYQLMRFVIEQTFENEINQWKNSNIDLQKITIKTWDFLSNQLTNDYLDKTIEPIMEKYDNTFNNTKCERLDIFKAIVNSSEYIDFITKTSCLKSSVYNKVNNKEYIAEFGEHFSAILQAVYDMEMNKESTETIDNFISQNLIISGQKKKPNISEITEFCKDIPNFNKTTPINVIEILNKYIQRIY